jgi:hypothetical protein
MLKTYSNKPSFISLNRTIRPGLLNTHLDVIGMACDGNRTRSQVHVRSRAASSSDIASCHSGTIEVSWYVDGLATTFMHGKPYLSAGPVVVRPWGLGSRGGGGGGGAKAVAEAGAGVSCGDNTVGVMDTCWSGMGIMDEDSVGTSSLEEWVRRKRYEVDSVGEYEGWIGCFHSLQPLLPPYNLQLCSFTSSIFTLGVMRVQPSHS